MQTLQITLTNSHQGIIHLRLPSSRDHFLMTVEHCYQPADVKGKMGYSELGKWLQNVITQGGKRIERAKLPHQTSQNFEYPSHH